MTSNGMGSTSYGLRVLLLQKLVVLTDEQARLDHWPMQW